LDCGRKLEYPEITYVRRIFKVHTERPQAEFEPGTVSL